MQMGYEADGGLLHRLTATSLDAVRWQRHRHYHKPTIDPSEVSKRMLDSNDCFSLLSERKVPRGILFCVEVQLFLTIFFYLLVVLESTIIYFFVKFFLILPWFNFGVFEFLGHGVLIYFGMSIVGSGAVGLGFAYWLSVEQYWKGDFKFGSYRLGQQIGMLLLFPFIALLYQFIPSMNAVVFCMYGPSWNFFKSWIFKARWKDGESRTEHEDELGLTGARELTRDDSDVGHQEVDIYTMEEEDADEATLERRLGWRRGWRRGWRIGERMKRFAVDYGAPILLRPLILVYVGIDKVVKVSVDMERRRVRGTGRAAEESQGLLDNLGNR
jgi:hypothetical protein